MILPMPSLAVGSISALSEGVPAASPVGYSSENEKSSNESASPAPSGAGPSPVKSGSAAGGAGGAGGTSALCATSCLEKPTPLRPATT